MTPSGIQQIPYELGTLYVREKRSNPNSRIIPVGFARIRSATHPTGTPTFHLPGGPGNTMIDKLQRPGNAVFLQYLVVGDLVMLEQRGYTLRGEQLLSHFPGNPLPLHSPTSLTEIKQSAVDLANASIAEYAGTEVDLSGYTILELADDVNDLRQALDYRKISLVGQSFGSQLSFAVMKRHPSIVKRALLSGVEPLNNGYDMPSHVFAAVRRMALDIDKDPMFQPYLPPGGYMAAIDEIFEPAPHTAGQRASHRPADSTNLHRGVGCGRLPDFPEPGRRESRAHRCRVPGQLHPLGPADRGIAPGGRHGHFEAPDSLAHRYEHGCYAGPQLAIAH